MKNWTDESKLVLAWLAKPEVFRELLEVEVRCTDADVENCQQCLKKNAKPDIDKVSITKG